MNANEKRKVAHWVKHGDQNCPQCVAGMRRYMHERAERRRSEKESV